MKTEEKATCKQQIARLKVQVQKGASRTTSKQPGVFKMVCVGKCERPDSPCQCVDDPNPNGPRTPSHVPESRLCRASPDLEGDNQIAQVCRIWNRIKSDHRKQLTKMQDINVGGIFNTVTAALPHLKKSKGNIVNVSSVSGLGGDWGMFGYNTSKGGVSLMTKGMALDLAGEGVRVNAVAPSLTRTDMADGIMDDDGLLERFLQRIPMGRPGEPEDVADVIAFLASRDARFVTGVVLPVDGGVSASNGQPQLG